ncbi:uncharacterized protein Tco025E_01714 [Trypanosoma conorhini]|uniref:F-box domain-containing protein n=1 Tax=Trypanosoma conorhini TaxID=83891 RepID=A0A3R7N688_9TRYP|nr:uncharacterized protein Tco025E_01714 [Trypanosoma conorhini]RNF26085.1 hypothetical protein Tco025E_01714 [Trypanosoma conorhini]
MDYWTRSTNRNSLESIGVSYDERDAGAGERARRVQVTAPERASSPNQDRDWTSFTDDATTTDTTGFTSSSRQPAGLTVHQRGGSSLGFTFSGIPADVVCFRSCISYHSHRPGRKVVVPEQSGPFDADVLCIILLYIAVGMREILQVSHTCRYWRFYANYAPHWTYYRRLDWSKRIKDLPSYIRKVVVKPKIVTQEEYFRERSKVQAAQRRDEIMGTARHVRWCIAVAVLSATACAANFVVAYFLGFLPTVLRSDATLGIVVFALMVTMVVLEVTVVIIPLGGARSPSEKQNMMRLLSWGLFLLLTACIFGTTSALAMARVRSSGHIIDGTVLDFSMAAECGVIDVHSDPSFVLLPSQITDVRWRPITMDDSERAFRPYCISHANATMCYVFLYFDAFYKSRVFNNASAVATRDIGTRTALGFDPIDNGTGGWCAAVGRPQVVALTESVYHRVREKSNRLFPAEVYTTPALRPQTTGSMSYLCSMDHARVTTEDTPGSTQMWYKHGQPWRRHYIPLSTDITESRETFREHHDHFLRYAYGCYLVASLFWLVMVTTQCLTREQAVVVLGATTTVTLALMNPIVMIVAGALCVNMPERYFMCSESSGGSLAGGGVFISAFLVAIYVCFF